MQVILIVWLLLTANASGPPKIVNTFNSSATCATALKALPATPQSQCVAYVKQRTPPL
jgi:hypothetical protein